MNIEELRQYCLSLPESVEKLPFERFFRGRHSILAFYTAGHIFCFIDIRICPSFMLADGPTLFWK